MKWNESYSVGIAEIDDQHRMLMQCIGSVESAVEAGEGWSAVHSALLTLSKYVDIHFAVEEGLMRIHAYPALGQHIAEHSQFRETLKAMQGMVLREDISGEMVTFLKGWWKGHIMNRDKDYAWFMPRLGAGGLWHLIVRAWFRLTRKPVG
jgi:hemerythrin-like metal-binding protein